MKTFLLIFIGFIFGTFTVAQVPQSFKYQAVVRDAAGNVLPVKNVSFRISIIRGTVTGPIVYTEVHQRTTNSFGLCDLVIGRGTVSAGSFATIDWGADDYFLNVELDREGGTAFQFMGATQLLSVPYALYAKKAGNGFSGNYNDLTNKPLLAAVATSGSYKDLSDKPAMAVVAQTGNYNDLSNKPVTDGSETKISAGSNVTVTGSGTSANPYTVSAIATHFPGELFGGGVVFHVDHTGQHGLIVGMVDLGAEKWSLGTDSLGAAGNNPWNGQKNTDAILSQQGQTVTAAKLCNDYTNVNYGSGVFSDWYLPAINQLTKLYVNLYEVNKSLENDGNSATTVIYYKPYWSSTENWNIYARGYACYFNFETGVCDKYTKSFLLMVRAIRSF